jgi:hypothetical protein
MSVSRRDFVLDASAIGLLAMFLSDISVAQNPAQQDSTEDTPHDSYNFWSGFFDSVNPFSPNYGQKSATRGPADQLPNPAAMTQYLHYKTDEKRLRYATDVNKDELLDHDGDVAVSIALSQYRPGSGDNSEHASQLRVDVTQTRPYLNIIAPLAWTAIASLKSDRAGKIPSLDQLGFKSIQATQGTSKILLNQGTGKLAVNISKAAAKSVFVKALNVMITGAKMAAPLVSLPAISVPALSSFTEALSYWEDRTKFLMAGNLTSAVATQQALADPERENHYIGLLSGDYLMIPQKHTADLAKDLLTLDLVQGYLVNKDADQNVPLETRAQMTVPAITYASMRVSVTPLEASVAGKVAPPTGSAASPCPSGGKKSSGKGGSSKSAEPENPKTR